MMLQLVSAVVQGMMLEPLPVDRKKQQFNLPWHKLVPVYLLLNLAKTYFKQNYNTQQLPLEMEGEQALFLILSIQVRNNWKIQWQLF